MPHARPRVLGERVPRRKTVEHREEQRRERVDARHRERHPEGMRGEWTRVAEHSVQRAERQRVECDAGIAIDRPLIEGDPGYLNNLSVGRSNTC